MNASLNFFEITSRVSSYTSMGFEYLRNKSGRNPHLTKSLILHFILVIIASGMIPSCQKPIKMKVVSVDIMPLSDKVSEEVSKPKAPVIQPKKPVTPPTPPKKVELPKPKIAPKPEVKKPPVKQEAIEKKKAIEEPQQKKTDLPSIKKGEVKPKPEPKPDIVEKQELNKDKEDQAGKKSLLKDLEKKEENLDDLFNEISKEIPKEPVKPVVAPQNAAVEKAEEEVPDQAFVNSLMQKIQSQISRCWSIPIGAKDVANMQVDLFIGLDSSGNVNQVRILDTGLYNNDNVYRVVADSAIWAIKECSPLQGLPTDKYKFWKEIEFTFNPALMAE